MVKRLTESQKAAVIKNSDSELVRDCDFLVDSNEGKDFYEGMIVGLDLAFQTIKKGGGINDFTAKAIESIVARCIEETRK